MECTGSQNLPRALSPSRATNIDDIFLLTIFFGHKTLGRSDVVMGQYVGFAALVAISLLGYYAALVIPRQWVGLLGFVPIAIGLRKLFRSGKHNDTSDIKPTSNSIFTIAAVTFSNGGDNIGIYVPLFASSQPIQLVMIIGVFFVLLGIWCVAGYYLGSHPTVSRLLDRWGHIVVPFVLIGLGAYILYESDSMRLMGFQRN